MQGVNYWSPRLESKRMEDPFGNILEIYRHSNELTYAAGAYQGQAGGNKLT